MTDGFMEGLLYLCGMIVAVGGAAAVVIKMATPYKAMKARLDKHDLLLANDNERLKGLEGMSKQTCHALCALLDHAVTGNSVEKCKIARDKLTRFLVDGIEDGGK